MGALPATSVTTVRTDEGSAPLQPRASFQPFWIFTAVLCLAFAPVLLALARYTLKDDLYSHILLIPFISAYLIRQHKRTLPAPRRGSIGPAAAFFLAGLVPLAAYFMLRLGGAHSFATSDTLFFEMSAFVLWLLGGAVFFLGPAFFRAALFPLLFLLFMIPFPVRVSDALEIASQHASAAVYSWMLSATGASYLRDGQVFALPGLTIKIAQECSGIRSSFVLFITGLLAGYMFLRTPWKRAALAIFVIPLGLLRNGFRVWVLSMLTIHWDPRVIDSPLHHKGGPVFFVLSLIPFFAFLLCLRKTDEPKAAFASSSK